MKISIGIIGSGPTAIFFLKKLASRVTEISGIIDSITIFEKDGIAGIGMPYSEKYTELCNMSNIASEEIPQLHQSLVDWLEEQSDIVLKKFNITRSDISKTKIFSRLVLGSYFKTQYEYYKKNLSDSNIQLKENCNTEVIDILPITSEEYNYKILTNHNKSIFCSTVVLASGHEWINNDNLKTGYFASPWPIYKILPPENEIYNYTIGILGASLSAFDVVSSLSRRHGVFIKKDSETIYKPNKGTEKFKIVLHDLNGWLPNLQYEQKEPMRELYRHISKKELLQLRDENGFLRLHTYFESVCKPVLKKAFYKDDMPEIVEALNKTEFGIIAFVNKMSDLHAYDNPFEGMKKEFVEAQKSVKNNTPIYWKEVIDDLMFTLNFHAELFPAEDHYIFHSVLMPFLLNVIAALPLESAKIMLALHKQGKLELLKGSVEILNSTSEKDDFTVINVEDETGVKKIKYKKFIACSGQKSTTLENFPFQSLVSSGMVREPLSKVISIKNFHKILEDSNVVDLIKNEKEWYMKLKGLEIDSDFKLVDIYGNSGSNLYNLSFTHTLGVRPYSYGLQACELTSRIAAEDFIYSLIGSLTTHKNTLEF
tara:strand:+ start:27089 stop:28876 length:1788 start_codon:yes stop_codon:yes gene_type:complete